ACSDKETLKDEETLEQILKNTKVTKYNLQSVFFSLEGVKIPAFIGKIRIRVDGTETMQRFVRLLLEYSEYSGIGIKCSLGMGAVRLEKEEKNAG
ncbi:MAG: CRISPR system precrRNA processing endoribonuclease RAMP protein Cas6, partial [Lachnospiraceae bacterium]|nr:CRISPR system precrRNA processing endoribonuclease RAMP protein Cas6 [Lachnospiraceae bacterium]